tara:strand:- start:371 stop:829 length:459 start_codon:yes stop_codon:yes gene_type:complete
MDARRIGMTDSTWDTRNRHKFAGVPVLSSKGRRLSLQSLEIIQRYRDGQRPIEISQEMGLPYQNVIGVVHRALKRGDVVDARKVYTNEERMTLIMNNPTFKIGSLTKHIARGMTEEVYFAIVKRMTAGGFKSFSEYMVEAAVDAHYAEEDAK